jgi:rhodanese-related sulfurtransferase
MFSYLKKLFTDDSTDLAAALKQGSTIIDVRSALEFDSGSAPGAVNCHHDTIGDLAKKIAKMQQPIVLCIRHALKCGVEYITKRGSKVFPSKKDKTLEPLLDITCHHGMTMWTPEDWGPAVNAYLAGCKFLNKPIYNSANPIRNGFFW